MPSSNRVVSGGSEADRFVLGLLRACADCLVVGSGTQAASPKSIWSPGAGLPAGGGRVRRAAGAARQAAHAGGRRPDPHRPRRPRASRVRRGATRPHHRRGRGAARARARRGADRVARARSSIARAAIDALRARGHSLILCEGGPHAIGPFLAAGLVDELFLTVSPLLARPRRLRPAPRARRGDRPAPRRAAARRTDRRAPRRRPPLPALPARRDPPLRRVGFRPGNRGHSPSDVADEPPIEPSADECGPGGLARRR